MAEDVQVVAAADGDLGDERHEVVRDAARVFADEAAGVRADGVEVAEQDHGELGIGLREVAEDLFGHVLGPAVGIGAAAGDAVLGERHLVRAVVDRGGGGEHDLLGVELAERLGERDRGVQVVVVVFQRLRDGFADRLQPGEMDGAVDLVLGEDAFERGAVADIRLIENDFLPGDLLDAVQGFRVGVVEVVDDDHVHALVEEFDAGVASDVSGSAGD